MGVVHATRTVDTCTWLTRGGEDACSHSGPAKQLGTASALVKRGQTRAQVRGVASICRHLSQTTRNLTKSLERVGRVDGG